jgi:UDP-N-acetylglucosamine 2-epimerase
MDSLARDQMVDEGFPLGRLRITGQPAFDNLAHFQSQFTDSRRSQLRARLEVADEDLLVVFVSQPLAEFYGSDPSHPSHPGYDERKVLQLLIETLERLSTETTSKIALAIRPHPRESAEGFVGVSSQQIQIVLAREENAHELVLSADLVTGMSSALLIEACYLGCVTVSVQPGLRSRDVLPTNASDVSRAVYRPADLPPVLRQFLMGSGIRDAVRKRLKTFQNDGRATQRVIDLAFELLRQPVAPIQS